MNVSVTVDLGDHGVDVLTVWEGKLRHWTAEGADRGQLPPIPRDDIAGYYKLGSVTLDVTSHGFDATVGEHGHTEDGRPAEWVEVRLAENVTLSIIEPVDLTQEGVGPPP
jgi:hypothetical protein